ncbi:hypothetical protein FC72_GL001059 [Companilactobacillus tucceti DSM 20183]|uniref:Uncharacterized protein n=1 Tax=Companilactobacillus tucceti DSM 20183 TaxID=1423811 RepID=A0A0R1IXC1_9LACO|nr:hypothetical protein [Companilactobacillus tucceti]KRK63822.1 hypothetical protein FC72_GL001059 [Companilactobacillus tucceti DSM 20183]
MEEYCIPVYHVNDRDIVEEFVNNNGFYNSHDHGEWAGSGMYFWDNISNAYYWKKQRENRGNDNSFLICKAKLMYNDDSILDLTDKNTRIAFNNAWQMLENAYKKCYGKSAIGYVPASAKIDFIISEIMTDKEIVKIIATYRPKSKSGNTIYVSKNYPSVDESAKVIICVRENTRLSSRQLI